MPIITNLDVMLAKRKMSLTQLSKAIGLWDWPKSTKKPAKRRVFIVAGAGFEPATSGLW